MDENGNSVSDSDDARVDITPRLIDLVVVKDASSPTPLNGIVNYSLTVTNKGPDTATNVQLADPAPARHQLPDGEPVAGDVLGEPGARHLHPRPHRGRAVGDDRDHRRATTVGPHINTATVTGQGGRETNPADNVDAALTVVPAPLKPPTAKPQPEPVAVPDPHRLAEDDQGGRQARPGHGKVTRRQKRVKGAKVLVKGVGRLARPAARTARAWRDRDQPAASRGSSRSRARVQPEARAAPKRIGVVGVFLPPLTG